MNIYVNGDSFTDGTGLGDYSIEGYPGDILFDKISSTTAQAVWMEKVYNHAEFNRVRMMGRTLAWPNLLSNKLNATLVNGSYPGSTLTSMFIRMINDLKSFTPELVFISLPNMYRIPLVLKDELTLERTLLSITPSSLDLYTNNQQQLAKYYWQEFDAEACLIFYLRDLIAISVYAESVTGKPPVLIDSIFLDDIVNVYKNRKLPITQELWEVSRIESAIQMKSIIDTTDVYVADGHFGHNIHRKFAEYLYKHVFKMI
jgi:hypothetical protein